MRGSTEGLWVLLPMRGISQGKSRLAGTLDAIERARFNRRLLLRTLGVLERWCGGLTQCIVVSACARTRKLAVRAGARALREPRPADGLNRALTGAAAYARRRGARALLVLPCDLPELSAAALDALLASRAGYARLALASDASGTGTNALLIAARARFAFVFGPDSRTQHCADAQARGWDAAVCAHPGLTLDIDHGHDLRLWRARERARSGLQRMV